MPTRSPLDSVVAALDAAAAEGRTVTFWWRDDDARRPTRSLGRLLALAESAHAPIALAVVPHDADHALAHELEGTPHRVWQHGYAHADHAGPGATVASELGDERPTATVLAELSLGRDRLHDVFGERFVPVLVPPFGQIGPGVASRVHELGYRAVSRHGSESTAPSDRLPSLNTVVDVLRWTSPPQAVSADWLAERLVEQIRAAAAPIGLLTHHLDLPERSWRDLEQVLSIVARHPAACWATPQALLDRVTTKRRATKASP